MVERYTFNPPVVMSESIDLAVQIDNLVRFRRKDSQKLPFGSYDLTPRMWTRYGSNSMFHHIRVEPDGLGIYHLIPKDPGIGTRDVTPEGDERTSMGGRLIAIEPGSMPMAILGPDREDPRIKIHSLVRYIPGASPAPSRKQLELMSEIVSEPVLSVDDGDRLILDKAREHVLGLPWQRFGELSNQSVELYEPLAYLTLRQSGMNMPFNMLDRSKPEERNMLDLLPPTHKRERLDPYWSVLTVASISPVRTTFVKDFLFTSITAPLAVANHWEPDMVQRHFYARSAPFQRASARLAKYVAEDLGGI